MNDPRLEAMGDTPGSDVCGCTRAMLAYPEAELERVRAERDEQVRARGVWVEAHAEQQRELERVRAERDELQAFASQQELWAQENLAHSEAAQARLDRAVEALREIATMSGEYSDGGSGVYHDCESDMRTVARAALAEIEEPG